MFPMELEGTIHIQYYGDVTGKLVIKAREKRKFEAFYKGLFESYRRMPDFAKKSNGEMMYWYENQRRQMERRFSLRNY